LRVRLFRGFLLVTCITAFCAWWLRSRIRPLATRMAVAERTIRSVLGAMDEGVVSENQNGDYLTCNSAAERILGLTAAEIGGHTATDSRWRAIHEDGSPWRAEDFPIKQALRSGRAQSESVMGIHRPDGTLVWISIRSAPVVVSGIGSGHGAVATFTDITQRRHAEELLRRSEQNLRLLIDSVQDHAIFMLDAQGCVSSWSRPAERINQYSAQEIIGRPFALLYTAEEGKAGVPAAELEAAQTHGHFEVDTWRTRKDGSRFHASVVITALRDEKSNLLGFSTVTRDLSERTEAARNLAQSNQLREIILEAAPFSIIAADIDGAILSINPATERMLQYSKEELVGHASMQSVHDPQEILTRSSELSQELGRRIEPGFDAIVCLARGGNTEEREWTYIRKDGFRIPVHLAVTVLRDLGDCVTGYLGIAYDITERRLREDHTRHVAHHDFLTGLPNRTLLYDRLDVAVNRVARGNGIMSATSCW
jgi:PAS domain S-box-containing protein